MVGAVGPGIIVTKSMSDGKISEKKNMVEACQAFLFLVFFPGVFPICFPGVFFLMQISRSHVLFLNVSGIRFFFAKNDGLCIFVLSSDVSQWDQMNGT